MSKPYKYSRNVYDVDRKANVTLGGPPKRVTKGVRRQLVKLHRQDQVEFRLQCAALGVDTKAFIEKYVRTP